VTGSGCSAAPASQSQLGWLALGGLLFVFARAIRRSG
jgi:MYXO-CTERM domain-containing protein